jgi:2-C-methyl-D-erythritol 4-phosphate cytidylyltransferase
MFDAVIVMAGSSRRANLSINKVFYEINGQPLFVYALEAFYKCEACENIVLVIRPEDEKYISSYVNERVKVAYGGTNRQDSVYNGIINTRNDVVLIHDGARANIATEQITEVYEQTKKHHVAFLANRATNAIKLSLGDELISLNRDNLWEAQTPQGVYKKEFIEAYQKASEDKFIAFDDIELVQKYVEVKPYIVNGDINNIKVTTARDLEIMKILLRGKKDV